MPIDPGDITGEEHWAKRGDIELFLYRRHSPKARSKFPEQPVLFLVHGSSFSARTAYDLDIPGHGDYSLMKTFAGLGYDVWTMDHEGYGRSSHTEGYSYIADGVEDLKAAAPVVEKITGRKAFSFFGSSSGALRAGCFASDCPDRVERLVLAALVWTVPNGTYIDMCINLPVLDPLKITCPVMIFRGDHDGIATDEDVMGFFSALPTQDKQLIIVSGQAHNTTLGINRQRFWHVLRQFLETPERIDN